MVLKIALFNHKGGVSKTTTTFNLGWMLASKGKRVILVDTDPQCNLTGMVLGFSSKLELEEIYNKNQNIKSALAPAFESQPRLVEAVDCIPIEEQDGLFLLPGQGGLAEYEVTLGIAQELSGSIQTLQNLPGSISYLLEKTAEKFSADYILIDMNPSLSSVNQNLLMTSDFFIVPTVPDFFSIMAIDSLAKIIPRWHSWAKKASELKVLKEATYPFPKVTPLFLGTIIPNYRIRNKQPSASFQEWIDRIQKAVSDELVPSLREQNMLLPDEVYSSQGMNDYCLTKMSDFNSLIAISQNCKTPVFALTKEQISQQGKVLKDTLQASSNFRDSFSTLADRIINLTSNAEGKAFINRLGEITAADAEEAQRAAELQAEAERKAAKEAQRAAELQVEKERKAAEEAKRAAQLRAEEERKVAEEPKRAAKLLEKFDGNPNKGEIFLKIRKIVSEELEIDEEAITLDTNISQDIDAESMEILAIIMAVEEEFDIEIDDEEADDLDLWRKEYSSYNHYDLPYKRSSSSYDTNSSSSKYAWLRMLSSASSGTSGSSYSIPPTGTVGTLVDYIYQKINETTETE